MGYLVSRHVAQEQNTGPMTLLQRTVLRTMADYADDPKPGKPLTSGGNNCFVGIETITAETGASPTGVKRARQALVAAGYLTITGTRPSGHGIPANVYRVNAGHHTDALGPKKAKTQPSEGAKTQPSESQRAEIQPQEDQVTNAAPSAHDCVASESDFIDEPLPLDEPAADEQPGPETPVEGEVIDEPGTQLALIAEEPRPPRPDIDAEFADWYARYPRKKARQSARTAYTKARKVATAEQIMHGLETYLFAIANGFANPDPTYTPYPATWLNGHRWEDQWTTDDGPMNRRLAARVAEERRSNLEREMRGGTGGTCFLTKPPPSPADDEMPF